MRYFLVLIFMSILLSGCGSREEPLISISEEQILLAQELCSTQGGIKLVTTPSYTSYCGKGCWKRKTTVKAKCKNEVILEKFFSGDPTIGP